MTADRPAAGTESARILVVDDERSMREMLSILLKREGHQVSGAESGRGAIDLLNQKPFDLVVSDARMPDVDGLEVLRHARSINPAVIAIMVTAYRWPAPLRGVAQRGRYAHTLRATGPAARRGPARRHRLRREAVQHRGPALPHPQGARSQAAAAGKR